MRKILLLASVCALAYLGLQTSNQRSTTELPADARTPAPSPPYEGQALASGADAADIQPRVNVPLDHHQEDVTTLRVRLLNSKGEPIESGSLEYFAGPASPENSRKAIHRVVSVASSATEISIPASKSGQVFIIASAPGCGVARERVIRPRATPDGAWQQHGLVVREVVIVLGAGESPGPAISGLITVQGDPRIPQGLKVFLDQHPAVGAASVEEVLARTPRLALLDRYANRYEASPLTSSVSGLWASSDETSPRWIPISWQAGDGNMDVTLDLSSGKTGSVLCVDKNSGMPIPGARLRSTIRVNTDDLPDGGALQSKSISAMVTANQEGVCALRGVPENGILQITNPASFKKKESAGRHSVESWGEVLLEVQLNRQLPDEFELMVEIDSRDHDGVRIWGEVPHAPDFPPLMPNTPPGHKAEPTIHYIEVGAPRSDIRSASQKDDHWEVDVAAESEFVFWVSRAESRVSEFKTVWTDGQHEVGPVVFFPREWSRTDLRWSDAPVGARLRVRRRSAYSTDTYFDSVVDHPDGMTVVHAADEPLLVELMTDAGDIVNRELLIRRPPQRDLAVRLHGRTSHQLELVVDGEHPVGQRKILLYALSAAPNELPSHATASMTAGTTASLPLPPGRYFLRVSGTSEQILCGVLDFESPDASIGPQLLEWHGMQIPSVELFSPTSHGLMVEGAGTNNLVDSVPESLRRFSLTDTGHGDRSSSLRSREKIWVPLDLSYSVY